MRYFKSILLAAAITTSVAYAQTDTTFTYQGELMESGSAADGFYSMSFKLFDALSGGSQVGSTVSYFALSVEDGLFNTQLDFGAQDFGNEQYWLEVIVAGNTLSPRQPMTASPFSIQTRGIFVDGINNIGIGTTAPLYPLHVVSDDLSSIYVKNTAGGTAYGVHATTQGTLGIGVIGNATASTGTTYGGLFTSSSTSGTGVYGEANASSGNTYGVYGLSQSTSGRGVYGHATAGDGFTYGVYGRSESAVNGRGVFGEAAASSGIGIGVHGSSLSTAGRGVYGIAQASTGTTYGVYGFSLSTSGRGVFGEANASTGTTYGGRFESDSTSGRGVYGYASASTGLTDGVFGHSESTSGRGIDGWASASSGTTYGVYGTSSSPIGVGVLGDASATSGVNYGVVGRSRSSSGFDFLADGAGTNYSSTSSRRWKSNIEPISDPLSKLAQLRGVYYDWDEEHGGHHDLGMIAEEVGKVLPEIVNYEENGYDAIGMDYSKMTPLLVEAVNALRADKDAEIEALNERIEQLEYLVNQLASQQEERQQ